MSYPTTRRLPCGCRDHAMRSCWLARLVFYAADPRPKILPPWERGKDWPKPEGAD